MRWCIDCMPPHFQENYWYVKVIYSLNIKGKFTWTFMTFSVWVGGTTLYLVIESLSILLETTEISFPLNTPWHTVVWNVSILISLITYWIWHCGVTTAARTWLGSLISFRALELEVVLPVVQNKSSIFPLSTKFWKEVGILKAGLVNWEKESPWEN